MKPKKEELFYFDCEWIPVAENAEMMAIDHPQLYAAFLHQVEKWNAKDGVKQPQIWFEEKVHMYPEFCKIITISYGYFGKNGFEVHSLYGEDEYQILNQFNGLLNQTYAHGLTLCGYSIKRFDMPWLAKRMMANGISPHYSISVYGKKPWEVNVFDLPEVWSQGCPGEAYTPFEMACEALGIESSKDDLSGREVKHAYYRGEIERIKDYCEKDVYQTQKLAERLIELMP